MYLEKKIYTHSTKNVGYHSIYLFLRQILFIAILSDKHVITQFHCQDYPRASSKPRATKEAIRNQF